ncbi:MAG: hypothetical protein ABIO46_07340 [Chitinophagales bacterium]
MVSLRNKMWLVVIGSWLVVMATSCDDRKVVSVTRVGELEHLIRDGDLTTHARLKDINVQPNLYAIGNVTNNDGLITVLDGKCYTTSVDTAKKLVIDSSCNSEATLLLYSNVVKWKDYEIPFDVTTWKQLEQFIGNMASKYNVSKTEAFCFRLNGTAVEVSWHVLKWRSNMKEITYKKMHTLGATGYIFNEPIEAIGFYSKESKEIFVHQETVLNMHFVNHDHSISGRIEDMKLDGKMKLYLPEESPQ